jgi:hypothetical protein
MGDQRLLGPLLAALAEILTTAVGIMHGAWSIVVIGVVLFVVQTRNFVKWYQQGARW